MSRGRIQEGLEGSLCLDTFLSVTQWGPASVGVEGCTVAATRAFHRAGLPQPIMEELMEPPEGSPAFSAQRSVT